MGGPDLVDGLDVAAVLGRVREDQGEDHEGSGVQNVG